MELLGTALNPLTRLQQAWLYSATTSSISSASFTGSYRHKKDKAKNGKEEWKRDCWISRIVEVFWDSPGKRRG